jgi:hypothetical protein
LTSDSKPITDDRATLAADYKQLRADIEAQNGTT